MAEAPAFADAILDVHGRHEYAHSTAIYRGEPLLDWAGLPDVDLFDSLVR